MATPNEASRSPWTRLSVLLVALVAAVLGMRLHLIFQLNINWDEFHYLSYLYEYQRGDLEYGWTNFHVHLFGWLTRVGTDEISQLKAARLLFYALTLASTSLLYLIGRRFLRPSGALFGVLCFTAFSFVMTHGQSFRPDPICTLLFLAALYCLLRAGETRWWMAALAGALMALSFNFTVKVAIHLLVIGAVLLVGLFEKRRPALAPAGAFAATFLALFPIGFYGHRFAVASGADSSSADFLGRTANMVLGTGVLFPRAEYLIPALRENPLIWLSFLLGGVICLSRLVGTRERRRQAALLLIMALPVLSLIVYRNAYSYFYVFILAPGVVLCGVLLETLLDRARANGSRVAGLLAVVMCLAVFSGGLAHYARNAQDRNQVQQDLIDAVHTIFPEPVTYIDRCSMVSSFPKVGFFMSTWGLESYRENGRPIVAELLRNDRPRFLLANVASLNLSWPDELYRRLRLPLLPEDIELLRSNFVPHWGILYVVGKRFATRAPGVPERFEIFVPGVYTLESAAPVVIDGVEHAPLDSLHLEIGWHDLESDDASEIRLRWGDKLFRPSQPPVNQPIFKSL